MSTWKLPKRSVGRGELLSKAISSKWVFQIILCQPPLLCQMSSKTDVMTKPLNSYIAQLVKAFTTGVNSDLPTLPSFRGKMSLSLSNSMDFALIPLAKMGKNSKKSYFCYFRSLISPWRGPQLKSLFGGFFLSMVDIFTIQKISLNWAPLQAFLNIDHNFGNICFLKKLWKSFGAKFGS